MHAQHEPGLARHNSEVSKQQVQTTPPDCNCRGGPAVCPVRGACQTVSVVYQATVVREDNNTSETYTGLTSRRFKDRFYEHTKDMKHQNRGKGKKKQYLVHYRGWPNTYDEWKRASEIKRI